MGTVIEKRVARTSEWNAFVISSNVFFKYLFFIFIVAILFMVIKIFNLIILDFNSDPIAYKISFFYPAFLDQYMAIRAKSGDLNAKNYALFFLVLILSFPFLLMYMVFYYKKLRKSFYFPNIANMHDLITVGLVLIFGAFIVILDKVKKEPASIYDFYVDSYGIYYFRQCFIFVGLVGGALILFCILLKLLESKRE